MSLLAPFVCVGLVRTTLSFVGVAAGISVGSLVGLPVGVPAGRDRVRQNVRGKSRPETLLRSPVCRLPDACEPPVAAAGRGS